RHLQSCDARQHHALRHAAAVPAVRIERAPRSPVATDASLTLRRQRHYRCGSLVRYALAEVRPCMKLRRTVFAFVTSVSMSPALCAESRRHIEIDVARAEQPLDRFFDLSVGSDYPGTLIRADSQAQLKMAVDELGFRYIRFHAIFHD